MGATGKGDHRLKWRLVQFLGAEKSPRQKTGVSTVQIGTKLLGLKGEKKNDKNIQTHTKTVSEF